MDDKWKNNPGVWNAYVLAGDTSAERTRRLREAPAEWQAQIRAHVKTARAIANGETTDSSSESGGMGCDPGGMGET